MICRGRAAVVATIAVLSLSGGLSLVAPTSASFAASSISSSTVQMTFSSTDGQPSGYSFPSYSNSSLPGTDAATNSLVSIGAASRNSSNTEFDGSNSMRLNHIETPNTTQAKVFYDAYWSDGTTKTASFAVQYDLSGSVLNVSLQNVTETSGYQLMRVHLPSLLSIRLEDGQSPWVLDANGGGALSPLSSANSGHISDDGAFNGTPNVSWYPLEAEGNASVAASMEVVGYMDTTQDTVYGTAPNKHASMGATALYRAPGASPATNIPVNQAAIARLTFSGDYDSDGSVDWLDLAKTIRDTQAPAIPSHYFDDKFVYQVANETGRSSTPDSPKYTFAQDLQLAGRISNLIDGNPQLQFVAGPYTGGHDTVEPSYSPINPALGGAAGYASLKQNAADLFNTNVSTDDNYDDQYDNVYTQGVYNSSYIARNADGTLVTGPAWNGTDQSKITGMKNYMADGGPGLARADGTIANMNLHDGTLIDAMSWWSIRNNFDQSAPASGVDNLVTGKFKLINEYSKYGVAVASELARYPFLGKLALNVDGPEHGGWVGGTAVPFMSVVLRHSTIYGGKYSGSIPNMGRDVDPKVMLLNNNRSARWFGASDAESDQDITASYYWVYRPWMMLSKLDVNTFTQSSDGNTVAETLSDKSGNTASIAINYSANTFSATYNGKQIMNGYSVSIPMDSNRIAFLARNAQTLTYQLPSGTVTSQVRASALYADHRSDVTVSISNGVVSVPVPAGVPVIVYLNGPAPTMINNADSAFVYTGSAWLQSPGRGLGDFHDDVAATKNNGDAATATFTGTGADLITETNSDEGSADVYVDGAFVRTISAYTSSRFVQAPVFSVGGLPYGTHTVKIVKSSGEYLIVDALKVTNNPLPSSVINDSSSLITYTGSWAQKLNRPLGDLAADVHSTITNGDSAKFTFYGTGVDVISEKNGDEGDASISVDGGPAVTVSAYATSRSVQQVISSTRNLTGGQHTITVTKLSGEYLIVDGFSVVS